MNNGQKRKKRSAALLQVWKMAVERGQTIVEWVAVCRWHARAWKSAALQHGYDLAWHTTCTYKIYAHKTSRSNIHAELLQANCASAQIARLHAGVEQAAILQEMHRLAGSFDENCTNINRYTSNSKISRVGTTTKKKTSRFTRKWKCLLAGEVFS